MYAPLVATDGEWAAAVLAQCFGEWRQVARTLARHQYQAAPDISGMRGFCHLRVQQKLVAGLQNDAKQGGRSRLLQFPTQGDPRRPTQELHGHHELSSAWAWTRKSHGWHRTSSNALDHGMREVATALASDTH